MVDQDRTSIIATLERVSAQLEATAASMGDLHANEIAGSAVRKSWKLIGEAIDHLRSIRGASESIVDRVEAGAFDKADDLTSIRGISAAFAEHLASLGVTRYAEIASWRADDVRRVAQALKLPSEISSQNWIEQAVLLERRKKGPASETPEFPQPAIALSADDATSVQKAGGRPAQDAVSPIDLPEIFDTIRNDEPAHQGPLPPPEARAVSDKPSRPRDAEAEPLAAASDERASDPASTESVVAARPNSQGSRVPIITASSSVSMDAAERMRRLEEEKLRLARKPGRVRESGEAEEAAVTFVIREQAQEAPPLPAVPSTSSRSSTLLRRTRFAGEAAEAEAYVANRGSAEEAEVVVIKPVVQNRYGQAATSEAGPVRRLLKALRGG